MSDRTGIQWTDATWNPTRGCTRVSEGCRNCYAEDQALRITRFSRARGLEFGQGPYDGLVHEVDGQARWSGEVRFVPQALEQPLRWARPRWIFVDSMSDLFHEGLRDEQIANVFGVMAAAPRHSFQVLTKRPARMVDWFGWAGQSGAGAGIGGSRIAPVTATSAADWRDMVWPLPNVWLGVSVENQTTADERIPHVCALGEQGWNTMLSLEPLLGPVVLPERYLALGLRAWPIVGGESGARARPLHIEWVRAIVAQCRAADVRVFVKQLGSEPIHLQRRLNLRDRKGGKPIEWPADLQIQEMPKASRLEAR